MYLFQLEWNIFLKTHFYNFLQRLPPDSTAVGPPDVLREMVQEHCVNPGAGIYGISLFYIHVISRNKLWNNIYNDDVCVQEILEDQRLWDERLEMYESITFVWKFTDMLYHSRTDLMSSSSDCLDSLDTEFLKAADTQTHVCATFSTNCAKFWILNVKL